MGTAAGHCWQRCWRAAVEISTAVRPHPPAALCTRAGGRCCTGSEDLNAWISEQRAADRLSHPAPSHFRYWAPSPGVNASTLTEGSGCRPIRSSAALARRGDPAPVLASAGRRKILLVFLGISFDLLQTHHGVAACLNLLESAPQHGLSG